MKRVSRSTCPGGLGLRRSLGDDPNLPSSFSFSQGDEIPLSSNLFPLEINGPIGKPLFQYEVTFDPVPEEAVDTNELLYTSLLSDSIPMSKNSQWYSYAFDYDKTLICFEPDLAEEKTAKYRSRNPETHIHFKKVKEIDLEKDKVLLYKILNSIILKCYDALSFTWLDGNCFNPRDYHTVANYRVFGGYTSSISYLNNRFCLILDTVARIEGTGTLNEFFNLLRAPSIRKNDLESSLIGINLVTLYSQEQRLCRFIKVRWNSTAQQELYDRNTGETIAQYLSQVYNFVTKPDDVIIEVQFRNKNELLPASALAIAQLTDADRRNTEISIPIREHTSLECKAREGKLNSLISLIRGDEKASQILSTFNATIGDSLSLQGRTIKPPTLKVRSKNYGHELMDIEMKASTLTFDFSRSAIVVPPKIRAPALILSLDSLSRSLKDLFGNKFLDMANRMGVQMLQPEFRLVSAISLSAFQTEIVKYISNNGTPSIILVVAPDVNETKFNALRVFLSTKLGIPSHFITNGNILDDGIVADQLMENVIIQVSIKTGGLPFMISQNSLPVMKTMVVGISSTYSETRDGVISITASFDHTFGRYYSDSFHISAKEPYFPEGTLSQFFDTAIKLFSEFHPESLARIIVYRECNDYEECTRFKEKECSEIIKVIGDISLIYCAVQSNAEARFFSKTDGATDNPPPGTVVFGDASLTGMSDFYICSKAPHNGIMNFTRYIVLYNGKEPWNDNYFAIITHYLTCLYPAVFHSLKVPSPLVLAEKLGDYITNNLNKGLNPSPLLGNLLHFI